MKFLSLGLLLSVICAVHSTAYAQLQVDERVVFPGNASAQGLPARSNQLFESSDYYRLKEKHIADVNGDGYLDYIGYEDATLVVIPGAANGNFILADVWEYDIHPFIAPFFETVEFHDADDDGKTDMLAFGAWPGNAFTSLTMIPGAANGSQALFNFDALLITSSEAYSSPRKDFNDVNGDGFLDFFGIDGDKATVILGNSQGEFDTANAAVSWGIHFESQHRELIDANSDGYLDFVSVMSSEFMPDIVNLAPSDNELYSETVTVAWGSATGHFDESPVTTSLISPEVYFRGFADVNGDGFADYVNIGHVNNGHDVAVVYGTASGFFGTYVTFSLGWSDTFSHVELVDADRDGISDLVTIFRPAGVAFWVEGHPAGLGDRIVARSQHPAFESPFMQIVDLDNDEILDFFGLNGERAYFVAGSRSVGFDERRTESRRAARFNDANDVRLADINRDGHPDLVLFGTPGLLENGNVFPCSCNMSSFEGATFLKAGKSYYSQYFDARNTLAQPIIAQFDTGFGVPLFAKISRLFGHTPARRTCFCGVVTDLNGPWIPSRGRASRYATSCVGLCGAQCGQNEAGLTNDFKRYKSLIIHDVCQAFIGSTDSMEDRSGRRNACGDEGYRGLAASRNTKWTQENDCEDGPVPAAHVDLIPPEFLP